MTRLLTVALVVVLSGASVRAEEEETRDEPCGLRVVLPDPGWSLSDLSRQGVVIHVYAPDASMVPRVTLMRFPRAFLPEGLTSRAAQLERSPSVRRVRLEAARLAGLTGQVLEYTAGPTRTLEVGARRGDGYLVVQVSASEADWQDEETAEAYRHVFESVELLEASSAPAVLRVDPKTPAEVRALQADRTPRTQAFGIRSHDLRLTIEPAEKRLVVVDDLVVEASAESISELDLALTQVVPVRASTGGRPLAVERIGERRIRIGLDRPLRAGSELAIRFEGVAEELEVAVDQDLVEEVAVLGQIRPDSSFSSHVIYYPIDGRNDASVRMAIDVPGDWVAVTGGEPGEVEERNGRRVFHYATSVRTPRMLPFGFAAGPFLRLRGTTPGGLTVDVYAPRIHAEAAKQRLAVALESGALLEGLFGPLPWRTVAICNVKPFRKETGVSLPGLILLSDGFFHDAAGVEISGTKLNDPDVLGLLIVADELSHQWNGYATPLPNELAEGVSTFTNLLYVESKCGVEEYRRGLEFCAQAYQAAAAMQEDVALADPALYRSKMYRVVAFCKTAVVLDLLRQELGDEAFFGAWRTAMTGMQGDRGGYEALERALGRATGHDLRAFFDQWVFQAGYPRLDVTWTQPDDGHVELRVEQTQPGGTFRLTVPVSLSLRGRDQPVLRRVAVSERLQAIRVAVPGAVGSIEIDPEGLAPLLETDVRGSR